MAVEAEKEVSVFINVECDKDFKKKVKEVMKGRGFRTQAEYGRHLFRKDMVAYREENKEG